MADPDYGADGALPAFEDLLRALISPVRREILERLALGPATPKELATDLQLSFGTISYHLGQLEDRGCITVVDERPNVYGPPQQVYGATVAHHLERGSRRIALTLLSLDPTKAEG